MSKKGDLLLPIDVTLDYRRNGMIFLSNKKLLENKIKINGLYVASKETEFEYLIIKKLFKGAIQHKQILRLITLVNDLGEFKIKKILRYLFGKKWENWILKNVNNGNWDEIFKYKKLLLLKMYINLLIRNPLNPFIYWAQNLLKIFERLRFPTGIMIVLLGPDGAGKTTVINEISVRLIRAFRYVKILHFRPSILLNKKKIVNSDVILPHTQPKRSKFVSLLKLFYYLNDYLFGYYFFIKKKLIGSTLILFDRYYYDIYVDPLRYRYGGPCFILKKIGALIPKPDLVFILNVSIDELVKRKQELPTEILLKHSQKYVELSNELSVPVKIVNGEKDLEEVINIIKTTIIEYLHERYFIRYGKILIFILPSKLERSYFL